MTLVVNFWGGPATGKSTTASGIFNALKRRGINAEYVSEFAKDLVWKEDFKTLADQNYVSMVQRHRVEMLINKVDVIVTDSPFPLGCIYYKATPEEEQKFSDYFIFLFKQYHNVNFLLGRQEYVYQNEGRNQTLEESKIVDVKIRKFLTDYKIPFESVGKVKYDNLTDKIVSEIR